MGRVLTDGAGGSEAVELGSAAMFHGNSGLWWRQWRAPEAPGEGGEVEVP
jgi:hypothetical protein